MKNLRTALLISGICCLGLVSLAVAGPGGTYGPGYYGPSGGSGSSGYGPSGGYGGYGGPGNNTYGPTNYDRNYNNYNNSNYNNYSGSGFGGTFGYGPNVSRNPGGYYGSKYPYNNSSGATVTVNPNSNTTITVTTPRTRPYYESYYGSGYNNKPTVNVNPGNNTRPSGNGPDSFGYYHRPKYYNGGWYHGDWRSNWNSSWKSRPYYWSGWNSGKVQVTGTAVVSPWRYGYWSYYNPYYTATNNTPAYINYSRPIVATASAVDGNGQYNINYNPANQDQAMQLFASARAAFFAGDYGAAHRQIDQALSLMPNDTVMHEFRALVMFATRQYRPASGAVYAVLSSGPGWNWTTLIGLYPSVEVYTQQLRALEVFCLQNPQASEAHFLLAYHYLTAGHLESAAEEYQQVLAVNPRDTLSAQLLTSLTGPAAGTPTAQLPQSYPARRVDPQFLIGHWTASRNDGSNFRLHLHADGTYRWRYTQFNEPPQEFSGTYTVTDNILVLTQNNQPAMVGQVNPIANNGFNFKLAGGDASDPGLNFQR